MQKFIRAFYSEYSKNFLLAFLIFISLIFSGHAQEYFPEYDELNLEMNISGLGIMDIPIAIKDRDAYLPVRNLFEYLKIKSEQNGSILSGFIIHPDSTFQINPSENKILFRNKLYELKDSDYIESPTTLYIKADLFGKIFGLNIQFSFRSLSLHLKTKKELPVIKERRLRKFRDNMDRIQGIIHPDTSIARNFPFFKAGALDWGIITTQQSNIENDNRLTLGLGTMFLGGETNLMLNYSTRVPYRSRNQFYQWRYVNNESRLFKQVTAGRIFAHATSTLFAPVSGVQISNSPFQNRRSFGTYLLNDFTEPRWTIELYVNNVLVDFTEADASGFYTFDVPLMYGNTAVSLRFYGPYGEERLEERIINIPYSFVPKNELEYTLSAGIVENDELDHFSRLNFNYGLSNSITIGGGAEVLNDVTSGEVMPFVNSSVRFTSNLLFSGEYMYGVKGEGILSYRIPGNLQVDLNYIKYDEKQTAINFNYLEERKISLSTPIRGKNFSMFSRFSVNQIIMPNTEFTTMQLLLSGAIMGISTNFTTYGVYNDRIKKPTIYSSLSQTYRLTNKFLFSPQIQYDFNRNQFNNIILELERPIFENGFLNIAYENNVLRNAHIFELGLRYLFNFAQTSLTSRIGNRNTSFIQTARGSLMLDDNTGVVISSNRTAMSRAAIIIMPFLDYNNNGVKNELEPLVSGMELKSTSGRITYNEDETILRITELRPYLDIMLEIDPVSLDNIAWKISNPKIKVHTIPNQFQEIHVPVKVMGEVAGMVYLYDPTGTKGQGRIIVNIFDETENRAARVLSEGDGYFTYLGLKPGKYTAEIDKEQLKNLSYTATPAQISFEIEVDEFGDIADDLVFNLKK